MNLTDREREALIKDMETKAKDYGLKCLRPDALDEVRFNKNMASTYRAIAQAIREDRVRFEAVA